MKATRLKEVKRQSRPFERANLAAGEAREGGGLAEPAVDRAQRSIRPKAPLKSALFYRGQYLVIEIEVRAHGALEDALQLQLELLRIIGVLHGVLQGDVVPLIELLQGLVEGL